MIPIPKLLNSRDPEEVKMCWDKLRAVVRELQTLVEEIQRIIVNITPGTQVPGRAVWTPGAFFSGEITVGQAVPRFIVPENEVGFVLTHLKISFQAGTPTGNTEIEVSLVSGGVATLLGTSVLASTDNPDEVYSVALPTEQELNTDDLIKWECVTAGAHEEVTAWVSGRQRT